jgi:ATP-dependent Lon protease
MNLNEFKLYCLKRNYAKIHNLFVKFEYHIYDIYKKYFINTTQKNIYINNIYELSKYINQTYNNIILNNIDNDDDFDLSIFKLLSNNNNCNDLYNIIENKYIKENIKLPIPKSLFYPLYTNEFNELLNNIIINVGFPSLNDFLDIYNIKINNIDLNITENFINRHFNILSIKKINNVTCTDKDINNIEDSNNMMNINFFFREIENNNYNIIIPYFGLIINTNKKYILEGIFIDDYLNLTSRIMTQISNPGIYIKKKNIQMLIDMNDIKKNNYLTKYLKYCDIGEILIYNKKRWKELFEEIYNLYIKIEKKNFSSILNDITNKEIDAKSIFLIIKLLLLGSDENINTASMLFLVLRDKKINNIFLSDIIYFSLNFVSQIKLKRININLKDELEKINEITYENIDLKNQVLLSKDMPQNVKSLAIEKINEMKLNNNDYYKQFTYVKTLLKFPWSSNNEPLFDISNNINYSEFLLNVENKLNIKTYGHKKIKEELILQVAKWLSNSNSNGCVLSLHGPPGVGKTLLAKSLSESLNLPFIQITLGGQNDGELLHGHGYTYSGSQPGLIIKKIIEAGTTRCILYLDELDKSSTKHGSTNEITSILIHLTDPNINSSFQDRFFQGVDFPLNKLIIIASYNDRNKIDPILLDRFIELDIKPYMIQDKINIISKYVMKELIKNINFPYKIEIPENLLREIIQDYTIEPGVREISRKIEKIILNLNKLNLTNKLENILENNIVDNKIIITSKIIDNILDINEKIKIKKINDIDNVGIINGLYATSHGYGGITTIQIFKNYNIDNNFIFKITGSQGDVMKESIQCAFNCAIKYISTIPEFNNYNNLTDYIKNNFPNGFHIHTPDTATPKDGPSAGCAFAIGFISIILNKKFNRYVAMTGEIDLNNNITKIGGLEYKLVGAKQAGIKLVLVPLENKNDIEKIKNDIPNLFDETFNYKLISILEQVTEYCFVKVP